MLLHRKAVNTMGINKGVVLLSTLFVLMFNCTNVYAIDDVSQQAVYNISQNNSRVVEGEGLHKENIESKLYIKDQAGNIQYGWTYDSQGNLYYATESGELITDGYNTDDCYFNTEGIYVMDTDTSDEEYASLENGGSLYLSDRMKLYDVYCDYLLNYDLCKCNRQVIYYDFGDKLELRIKDPVTYDRESVKEQILNTFGKLSEGTTEEKMYEACNKVSSAMNYNLDYTNSDLIDAVNARQGVCWHFVKATKVLLEDAGVTTELLYVRERETGGQHVLLRCLSDGKWVYCDPTFVKSLGLDYSNIGYREVINRYIPDKYVHYMK